MKHSHTIFLLLWLLLNSLSFMFTTAAEQCSEQIISEPWNDQGLLIRYNRLPCYTTLWFSFCENSGWGDKEASVACRELGYAHGVSGFSVAYQGARSYSSIECDGSESRLDECDIGYVDYTHDCSQVGVAVCNNMVQVYIKEAADHRQVSELPVELCIATRGQVRETVQVLVETSNNSSALANFDYVPVRSTIMFGPSLPPEQCVEIDIIDDSLAEGPEEITILLTSPSPAINIIDDAFIMTIEPNDFETEACVEGSVTLVSDSSGNNLQLVEMCSSEGVWSPVCDYDWTLHDATVVCRERGKDSGTQAAKAVIEGSFYTETAFPECSGNETRLGDCFTTTTGAETACRHVLVNCNVEDNVEGISLWMVLAVIIVVVLLVLIIGVVIGLVAVIYSKWKTVKRVKSKPAIVESPTPLDLTTNSALPELHPPLKLEDGGDNTVAERELDTLSMDEPSNSTDPYKPPSSLSETPEHHLINPLYGDADEPPTLSATQDGDELGTTEPHYDIPYASPPADSIGGLNYAMKHHKYEYIDNPVAVS